MLEFLAPVSIIIIVFSIITGNFLLPIGIIVACVILFQIIKKPINGLIVLPFVSYLIPSTTNISMFSPGMVISIITFCVALVHIVYHKKINKISNIWIVIFLMAINMSFVLANSDGSWLLFLHLIQGIAPFILFSLIVDNESEARRVITFWLLAFSIFCFIHLGKAFFTDVQTQIVQLEVGNYVVQSGQSTLVKLSSVRNRSLGGFNPNVLGWVGTLYLPLAPILALGSKKKEKIIWWLVFFVIVFLMIFTLSRAAMLGMFLTFLLLLFYLKNKIGKQLIVIILPILISSIALYFIWQMASNEGAVGRSRTVSIDSILPAIKERWQIIVFAWEYIFSGQQTSARFSGGSHSGFTKAALEFGLSYFLLYCIPFIYMIIKSVKVSKFHFNPNIQLFTKGLLIAGIVATIQGIFGITLFSSLYAQVFWLFIGYLYVSSMEIEQAQRTNILSH